MRVNVQSNTPTTRTVLTHRRGGLLWLAIFWPGETGWKDYVSEMG